MHTSEFKGSDKALQIEIYPGNAIEQTELEQTVKQRVDAVVERYNKLNSTIGLHDISSRFILTAPLYQIATKIKHDLEKADGRYTSSRSNFSIIMEEFNNIEKTLKESQAEFHKETIFGQKEIEQVS